MMQSFQNNIDRLGLVRAELKCDQEPRTLDVANCFDQAVSIHSSDCDPQRQKARKGRLVHQEATVAAQPWPRVERVHADGYRSPASRLSLDFSSGRCFAKYSGDSFASSSSRCQSRRRRA